MADLLERFKREMLQRRRQDSSESPSIGCKLNRLPSDAFPLLHYRSRSDDPDYNSGVRTSFKYFNSDVRRLFREIFFSFFENFLSNFSRVFCPLDLLNLTSFGFNLRLFDVREFIIFNIRSSLSGIGSLKMFRNENSNLIHEPFKASAAVISITNYDRKR